MRHYCAVRVPVAGDNSSTEELTCSQNLDAFDPLA